MLAEQMVFWSCVFREDVHSGSHPLEQMSFRANGFEKIVIEQIIFEQLSGNRDNISRSVIAVSCLSPNK